jgi:hypothetical protein
VAEARATEHQEQKALIQRVRLHEDRYPELKMLFAIPNGGLRRQATAGKLKAEGVKPGVPDLFLAVPKGGAHGLFIELKAVGGTLTERQASVMRALTVQGYEAVCCVGHEQAWDQLMKYLLGASVTK